MKTKFFLLLIPILIFSGCGGAPSNDTVSQEGYISDPSDDNNKWLAGFEIQLKYEVQGITDVVGHVTYDILGGFTFTPDFMLDELVLVQQPSGFMNINSVVNDVPGCQTTTVGDSYIWVNAISGDLVGTDIVFNKEFVTLNHTEGISTTCHGVNFSDANASVFDWIKEYAFPIIIPFEDGATAPIQGSFSFSGRQAEITGIVTITKVTY